MGPILEKIHQALEKGELNTVKNLVFLHGEQVIHDREWNEPSPMEIAAFSMNMDAIQLMESFSFKLTDLNYSDESLLYIAAAYDEYEVAKFLINQGVPVEPDYRDHPIPLFAALDNLDFQMVKLLVRSDADIKSRNGYGQYAIDFLVSLDHHHHEHWSHRKRILDFLLIEGGYYTDETAEKIKNHRWLKSSQ